MPFNSRAIKDSLEALRGSQFKSIYAEVTAEMLNAKQWSPEEQQAMQLLSSGHSAEEIQKQIDLNAESNQKMADLYFMILLNSLIRCQNNGATHVPFSLPQAEITSWTDNYSREDFAQDLLNHKDALNSTSLGREVLGAASEYTTLYESTKTKNSEESSTFDNIVKSLDFLGGIADGLTPMSRPLVKSSVGGGITDSYSAGFAVGLFATGVCEVGGLISSLMK
ncbi:hypothetical protein ACD661_05725 [Legionella lytica]|uniref:Dot/Icm secretion system substrate n=1 Tax=Legionella lytica TaxID=96232 RepID=A0ABW8D5S8_9GAMM